MYSHRFEHSHSRQYSDRSSRQWDGHDEHWETCERRRDKPWDSRRKYGGSSERTSRNREYIDSLNMPYGRDSLNRERSRKSPVMRRFSSPDGGGSEKKSRRCTEGDEDDYRYRRMPEDKTSRQLSPGSACAHTIRDFKRTVSQEEDFICRKASQDSRHRHRHEEFPHRHRHDDTPCRRSSGYYKDRQGRERSWDRSPERTRARDHSAKYFEKDVAQQRDAVPEQKKQSKGFQRFLDVLNKGVKVETLTKIVTQTSVKVDNRPPSPNSSTADQPWSPSRAGRRPGSRHNSSHWNEGVGSWRPASPLPRGRSLSPRWRSLSNEKSLQRCDGEHSYSSSDGRSQSPSGAEKTRLTPEDEHKHKQMQDVLQAIGMNLGFEELGQMSHRIQERLYGKKESGGSRHGRQSTERDSRIAFSPRPQNRSSSSRSSFSPSPQESYMKKDSYSAQRDVAEEQHQVHGHQASEYGPNGSSSILRESENCETNSKENTAVTQSFSQNVTYSFSEPSSTPVMPMYSPVNRSPLPFPPLAPTLPHAGAGPFMPCLPRLPPFLSYPRVPPLNMSPAMLAHMRQPLPPHIVSPRPLLNVPIQPPNASQKSKMPSRPRCLQVIDTKQPG